MTPNSKAVGFPGGSKSRVNRAGEAIRGGTESEEDLNVIDDWRAAHRAVLNTFQAILRTRTRGQSIIVAQRHKRKRTIFDKLRRLNGMQLSRMDDVAGCRLIFGSIAQLKKFRQAFHSARFNHSWKNEPDKYNYIKNPKPTGYRGIHDVYQYDVRSSSGRALKGLYVEIQYRTLVQHAWSTAVEVVGFITESQPKFQRGDVRYQRAMALAAEILARSKENTFGPFPEMDDKKLVEEFKSAESELKLLKTLRGLRSVNKDVSAKRNAILIFSPTGTLEVKSFRDSTDALRVLFTLERDRADSDIVLVRADSSDDVRLSFKNYFSDAGDFVTMVEQGCSELLSSNPGLRASRVALEAFAASGGA